MMLVEHTISALYQWNGEGTERLAFKRIPPHFDAPELVQSLTFRLADSLPQHVAERLRDDAKVRTRLEEVLDRGAGACWLSQPAIAEMAQDALLYFDDHKYRLLAWCVMPNHVHVVLEPAKGERLGDIVSSWKRFTARKANELLGRSGTFWQADYWDRFIRDERHLAWAISYAEDNPVKAGLTSKAKLWRWSSARLRP